MRHYRLGFSLLALSIVIHAVITWRLAREIESDAPPVEYDRFIVYSRPPKPTPAIVVPPEEQLEFDAPLDLNPPEILIAPKAVTAPPPDVTVALRAQSGGFSGIDFSIDRSFVPVASTTGIDGFKAGIGNGLGDGSARFAAYIQDLREVGLDVVFVIDATGSMGWVIDEVKDRIEDIAHFVRTLVPIARFGFVAYRDKDDPEFTTKVQPLTYSMAKLRRYLSTLEAEGGGDWYEEIDAGVQDAIEQLSWRPGAQKQIIIIGDAPMRKGQMLEVIRLVEGFLRFGGNVSTLDVSEQANPHLVEAKRGRKVKMSLYRNAPMKDFLEIGKAGEGDAATLDGDIKLTKRLVKLILGDRFALELQSLLDLL